MAAAPGGRCALALPCLLLALAGPVQAQETRGLGLPPASGSQNPVLPPPSGSQYPVLPPQSGERYVPGVGGPFGEGAGRAPPPRVREGAGDVGVVGAISPATQPLAGPEIDRLDQIAPALRRCWSPPVLSGSETGVMATVRFSLRRDGSLFGQPRLSWSTRRTDASLRERFGRSIIEAVQGCTPLRLSPGLGASIAGRPFSIRFHGRVPGNERQI